MSEKRYGNPLWIGPLASATGFGDEGRGFVCALRRLGVPLAASMVDHSGVDFLRELAQDFPEQILLLNDAVAARAEHPVTAVVHAPGAQIPSPPEGAAYAVCRTMWETDGLTAEQVAALNTYDEIWVPSTFNRRSFADAGVRAPLVVVPEGVDTSLFRPGRAPLSLPGGRTVFLSMFEWSHRKAPDVLLRAWAEAFSPADDVTLVLRCYPRNRFGHSEDSTEAVDRLIEDELARQGLTRADVAPIVVLGQRLSPGAIPALYAAASCYVSPARGEGWGRPLMEAMAMGLPVITTRWGAPLDFLSDGNAFLVDVHGLEPVDERMDVPAYRGQRWAAPDAAHLAEILATVAAEPAAAGRVGHQARSDVVQRWQWKRVAGIAASELERIAAALRPPARHATSTRPDRPQGASAGTPTTVCTIATRSYLPAARVLCASVVEHHPEIRPTVLVVDGTEDLRVGATEPFEVIGVEALGIPPDTFAKMALIYSATELCCALKPWLLTWALRQTPAAIYLDSDIWVTRPLEDAFGFAAEHGVVLTPHVCHPMPRDGCTPNETDLLASGIFNLGFVGVGPGGEDFLEFWKERLEDDGIIDQANMRQADQRWVDFVPGCFPNYVWRDPAANVAYWNLHERVLSEGPDGRPLVDGEPLAFFHFSGFHPGVPDVLSRYAGPRPRTLLRDNPALARLCERYRAALLAAGHRRAALEPYGFDRLPSGEVLTSERRRAYREALLADAAVEDASPPVPSASEGHGDAETPLGSERPSARRRSPTEPLVSVLVPTRNRERFLAECLSSILAQTYTNLEVVVLDNCSSDASAEIASSFAEQDGRLTVARSSHDLGLIGNHRRGLDMASSDLVKFVHDDDVLEPSAIERMVEAMDASPQVAIATSPRKHIDAEGTPLLGQPPPLGEHDAILDGRFVGDAMLSRVSNIIGEASTILFRRSLLDGSPYASFAGRTYDYLTDVSTWLVLLSRGSVAYTGEPLSRTRLHGDQDGTRLGRVREALDWIDLAEQATGHGWLSAPSQRHEALQRMLSHLVSAASVDPTTEATRVERTLLESLTRLRHLDEHPGALEPLSVGAAR